MNRNYNKLPKIVHDWLWLNKAWIVGSGVTWYLGKPGEYAFPKDLDIVIPPNQWNLATKLINSNIKLRTNTFGGFKGVFDGVSVDFWPDNIEDLMEKGLFTSGKDEIFALRLNPHVIITGKKVENV